MSDDGGRKKLIGALVHEDARFTKQGPRRFRENGQFAPGKFEEVKLTVLAEESVQVLFESLPRIFDAILMVDDGLLEIRGTLGTLQNSLDQIILRHNHELFAKLDHACTLLRRAENAKDGGKEILIAKETEITVPLATVALGIDGCLADAELPPAVRLCLVKRLLLIRHVQAKVRSVCGDSDAWNMLRTTRARILSTALEVFAELTSDVAVLDVPEVRSAADELRLLQLMEIIDGEAPDDRRFRLRKATPRPLSTINFVELEVKLPLREQPIQPGLGQCYVIHLAKVHRGELICSEGYRDWISKVPGYLFYMKCFEAPTAPDSGWYPSDFKVLETPEWAPPRVGLADLIAELAFIVDYARGLDEEMGAGSGNIDVQLA